MSNAITERFGRTLPFRPAVLDLLTTPPGSPVRGDRYLIIATATGAWTGKENQIAEYGIGLPGTALGWIYEEPAAGWSVYDEDGSTVYVYDGNSWDALAPVGGIPASMIDVTQVDAYNLRLAADDLQDTLETLLDHLAGLIQPIAWRVQPRGVSGVATWDPIGTAAPTVTAAGGTTATPVAGEGLTYAIITSTSNGNAATWVGNARVALDLAQAANRRRWLVWRARIRIASDGGTSARYWAGLFSADPSGSNDPTLHGIGFRFSTGASDTNWQCWTNDNSGGGAIQDSGVAASVSTLYDLAITFDGERRRIRQDEQTNALLAGAATLDEGELDRRVGDLKNPPPPREPEAAPDTEVRGR